MVNPVGLNSRRPTGADRLYKTRDRKRVRVGGKTTYAGTLIRCILTLFTVGELYRGIGIERATQPIGDFEKGVNKGRKEETRLYRTVAERKKVAMKLALEKDECYTQYTTLAMLKLPPSIYDPFGAKFGGNAQLQRDLLEKRGVDLAYPDPEYWNFFDHLDRLPADRHIVCNPPFSCIWQVIHTLCELRRDFDMIVNYTVLENDDLRVIQLVFGGEYDLFEHSHTEGVYRKPDGTRLAVRTGCLQWRF